MEQSTGTCFLTGEECIVTDVSYNDKVYWIKEDTADEYSLKKLREMIASKLKEEEEKRQKALDALNEAVKALGIDQEAFKALVEGKPNQTQTQEQPRKQQSTETKKDNKDDDYEEIEGDLKSPIRARVSAEEGIGAGMSAYTKVEDPEGKRVVEENKKKKRIDDGLITKGSLGTTVIKLNNQNSHELNKMLSQVDEEGNLIRAAVSGGNGKASGINTVECSLCRGSGITRIGNKTCPKCGGVGLVTA